MVDDHVQGFAPAYPAHQLALEEGANPLEGLNTVRFMLTFHGLVHFPEGAFTGGGHPPG